MKLGDSTQGYTDFTNTMPTFHTIQPFPWNDSDYVNNYDAPTPPEDPISSQFVKVLKGILFILCLIENSIALYILCKNVRIGRSKTFFLYMLISMACADILIAIFVYLMTNAAFSHQGKDVWFVSNALCKMYLTFSQIASRVIALTLVALAWDAIRNSSSKGRKKHTRKFSAITTFFLWVIATGFSSIYFVFSELDVNACGVNPEGMWLVIQLDFGFDVTVNLILTILCVVVFFRLRRMKKDMNSLKRSTKIADKSKQKRHRRDDDGSELDHLGEWRVEKPDEGNMTICEGLKKSSSKHLLETFNMETEKAIRPAGGSVHDGDAQSITSQSAREQELRETRTEAKITIAISIPLVALTLLSLLLPYLMRFLSYSQIAYVSFSVQVVGEIYGITKPAIYACIDREFRERYMQLSPFACCCFRKICRG